MLFFGIGLGGSFFAYLSETLTPTGVSIVVSFVWLMSSFATKTLPLASDSYGDEAILFFYGICSLVMFIVLSFLMIETKGKTEEQIIKEFKTRPYKFLDFS